MPQPSCPKTIGVRVVVSPHIGDLNSPRGRAIFAAVTADLQTLYGVQAERLVHDAHPDFPNSRWVQAQGLPTLAVWHHHAHAAALAGEFGSGEPLLCFTWDCVGLGPDGTLWGGEALLGTPGDWHRAATLRPFRLPGGERAARQPWRSALALHWETDQLWQDGAVHDDLLLHQAFERGLNAPWTSAAGRLFDAAAAVIGQRGDEASFEGEAPMQLEAAAAPWSNPVEAVALPLQCDAAGLWRSDWTPLLLRLRDRGTPPAERAALFHLSLAAALCAQAQAVRQTHGITRVGLCDGVFQNRLLSEAASLRLQAAGFTVLLPQCLPVNDAAISYGQIVETAARGATPELNLAITVEAAYG